MNYKRFLLLTGLTALVLPTISFAAETYTPLVGIPGVSDANDFNSYLNAIYALSISIAALIAVIKIVIAGAKYMLDDIVTHKTEAKAEIKSSIIGLLIIIGAVVILNTINGDLTNMQLFDEGDRLTINDTPPDPIITPEAYCAKLATQGRACEQMYCDDLQEMYGFYVNPNNIEKITCKAVCDAVGGHTSDGGLLDCSSNLAGCEASQCNFGQDVLEEELNNYLKKIAADSTLCPSGAGTCDASYCVSTDPIYFGTRYNGVKNNPSFASLCSTQCSDARQGSYDEESGACVYNTKKYLTEDECKSHSNTVWQPGMVYGGTCNNYTSSQSIACESRVEQNCDPITGVCADGATVYDCDSATNSCESLNGIGVVKASGDAVVCYIP